MQQQYRFCPGMNYQFAAFIAPWLETAEMLSFCKIGQLDDYLRLSFFNFAEASEGRRQLLGNLRFHLSPSLPHFFLLLSLDLRDSWYVTLADLMMSLYLVLQSLAFHISLVLAVLPLGKLVSLSLSHLLIAI